MGSPHNLQGFSTHCPPSMEVEEGWTKGGERVDKGWRNPTLSGLFLRVLSTVYISLRRLKIHIFAIKLSV